MLEEVTIVFRGSAEGPPEMPPLQLENFISAPSLPLKPSPAGHGSFPLEGSEGR